jgi:hypothetical protein
VGFRFLGEDFPDFTFVLVTWACLRAFVAFSTGWQHCPPPPRVKLGHFVLLRDLRDRPWSGFRRGCDGGLNNTTSADNMVPTRSKALLLCGWLWRDHFVRGGLDGSTAGPCALLGHLLCKRRFCLFPLAAAPVVGRVVAPQLRCSGIRYKYIYCF